MSILARFADEPAWAGLRQHGDAIHRLRDLYVQMHCYCKLSGSDGFVPAGQLPVLAFPASARMTERDLRLLLEAGVIETAIGGYLVPGYLRGNKLRAEAERQAAGKAEGARRANHERWHRRRDEFDPRCEFCLAAHRYADGSTDESTDQYSDQSTDEFTDQYSDQIRESVADDAESANQAELFKRVTPPIAPPAAQDGDDDDPHFTEFWSVYPRKVGKPRSRKAWRAAMRRRHDPALIIKAAAAYRDDPRRNPQYTAHPSTWLNDERYNDGPPESSTEAPGEYDWEA